MASDTQKATASLDGWPLILTGNGIEWVQREGVLPNVQNFMLSPEHAKTLGQAYNRPVELLITPSEGNKLRVTNLWVLNVQPGPNPFLSEVTVADRRWFWSYGIVVGFYNMRRAIGTKRLIANDLQLVDLPDTAADIGYWKWSLQDGHKKFTAATMLEDVMKKVTQAEKRHWGGTPTTVVDGRLDKGQIPIEDLALNGIPGDQAVNIVKSFLPEAGVRVDNDGTITFYSRPSQDEEKIVEALMPEVWGEGHTDLVANSLLRPKEIHVLFTRKVEVRFDFLEAERAENDTTPSIDRTDLRQMENVLALPDYQLQISGETYPQGSWVGVNDYMRSLPNIPIEGGGNRKIDHDLLQRAFVPWMDLWSCLELTGERPNEDGTLSPWIERIAALERNYRTAFRLNRRWVDRFMSWACERIATVNVQTGQRGPTVAYGDYCIIPSQRAKWRNSAQGHPLDFAINKTAYPQGGRFSSSMTPSPGLVNQLDMDQGILRVDYSMDLNRTYEMVLPSQMDVEFVPTADATQRTRSIAFNAFIEANKVPRLSKSFKLAVIITAVPAAPNGAQQLHRIVVKPSDVTGMIPEGANINEARGPVMEIRVGPGREVARIHWDDDKADLIEKIFGLQIVPDDEKAQAAFSREVSEICINEEGTSNIFGVSLNAIAKAEAAAVYASLSDRYEGSMTAAMNGNVQVAGWASEIRHQYRTNGETLTQISLPRDIPRLNMLSFLSSSVRAVLMRLAKP